MKRFKNILSTIVLIFVLNNALLSQNTIGLVHFTDEASPGYTLFAPLQSTTTYLIDNCGHKVMEWTSEERAGTTAYLMPDGNLIRSGALINDRFIISGKGGLIEIKDWNDDLVWSFTLSDSTHCLHHDIEVMPNGNILTIASEYKTEEEALAAGRPDAEGEIYNEKIIEIAPNYETGGADIVWEWSAWDHLVQDVDSSMDNYGIVSEEIGKLDFNYYNRNKIQRNWLHINSVDYNEDLDQIILSSRILDEIWIIDHSTTTEEAASDSGGRYGKGGELLYRWGNPQVYKRGEEEDRMLGKQHDAQWIESEVHEGDRIMIFNNEYDSGQKSAVHIIEVPINSEGHYINEDGAFLPMEYNFTYASEDFHTSFAGGVQMQKNGNLLLCDADDGQLIEVNQDGERVWRYINPVSADLIANQGTDPATISNDAIFKTVRYTPDFPGFSEKDLDPSGPVELMSDYDCGLTNLDQVDDNIIALIAYPNPAADFLNVPILTDAKAYNIYDLQGQVLSSDDVNHKSSLINIDISFLHRGTYILETTFSRNKPFKQIFIKQ